MIPPIYKASTHGFREKKLFQNCVFNHTNDYPKKKKTYTHTITNELMNKRRHTLHSVYASLLSQLVGLTFLWDPPIVREMKHLPDAEYIFLINNWANLLINSTIYSEYFISFHFNQCLIDHTS